METAKVDALKAYRQVCADEMLDEGKLTSTEGARALEHVGEPQEE